MCRKAVYLQYDWRNPTQDRAADTDPKQEYLNILQRFTKLETLNLPASSALGLGFDGGPWCGSK